MSETTNQTTTALAPWLQEQLVTLRQQRGHALMLSGPAGLGQYELAYALAKTWLCETPTAQGACGACGGCHAVDQRSHPDLHVLVPEVLAPDLDWPIEAKAQDEIDKKSRKPSKWIRVDAARTAVAFTQLTVSRARHQVVLIHPAHRLNVEAANTLLKTLEEPPGETRFILACESLHQVLPTIRSRCHIHQMGWPSEAEAIDWLQMAVTPKPAADTAATWLRAAGGRAQDALAWAHLGLTPQQWQRIPKDIASGEVGAMAEWAAPTILDTLQKVAHDAQATWVGATPRFFNTADIPALPHLRALEQWAQRLADWRRSVEHPFNAGLQLEAWMADCRQVFTPTRRRE